eukprot:CAMPEP_0171126482 /NCGR_PEP_ID=MMETSP0766_2-20121228/113357_1 /TAXON_ID=439317 /ORGANISM="Gambierdiscus australes, Strain CAWD 149" /LENGTH=290 /DNA_ID=CAMNT_0011589533 /DNA_START=33 /DNA_END=903 /DNA_ORIENTATION=-
MANPHLKDLRTGLHDLETDLCTGLHDPEDSGGESEKDQSVGFPMAPPAGVPRCWRLGLLIGSLVGATAALALLPHLDKGKRSAAMTAAAESKVALPSPCLCLFDVDRTLTGKQKLLDQCPGNSLQPGVWDTAFGGGVLTLSVLAQGVSGTFCGQCYKGVVSAGSAGGPKEKQVLARQLIGNEDSVWSGPGNIQSQFVIGCPNTRKALCARGIVNWFEREKGILIPPGQVYFFDDLTGNTAGFAAQGFNARQVSCASREGDIGLCGAHPQEIMGHQASITAEGKLWADALT